MATGLLRVDGGWVTGGPALEGWPPGNADLLAGWLAGLLAVCAAESYPRDEDSMRLQALALLMVLDGDGVPVSDDLWPEVTAVGWDGDHWSYRSSGCGGGVAQALDLRCLRHGQEEQSGHGCSVGTLDPGRGGRGAAGLRRVQPPGRAGHGQRHQREALAAGDQSIFTGRRPAVRQSPLCTPKAATQTR